MAADGGRRRLILRPTTMLLEWLCDAALPPLPGAATLWTGVAVAAVAYWICWSRSAFVRAVDAVPGPKGWPLVGNALQLNVDQVGQSAKTSFFFHPRTVSDGHFALF